MRSWRSSLGVLLWAQGAYLLIVLVLLALALAARPLVATSGTAVGGGAATAARTAPAATLVAVVGTVVARGDGLLAVHESGGEGPVAFMVDATTAITRAGDGAALTDLRRGDTVRMVVDGRTGRVLQLRAEPGAAPAVRGRDALGTLAVLVLIAGAALVARRRSGAPLTLGRGERSRSRGAAVGRPGVAASLSALVGRRRGAHGCEA